MMTALATVASVEHDSKGYRVELSCEQQTSCSSCSSQKSCGTGIVSKAVGNKALSWQLTTQKGVSKGEVVEIGFPEKSLIQSAAVVYIVPLLMMMFGALIGQWLLAPVFSMGEGIVILSSVLFAWGGFTIAKRLATKLEQASKQQVILLRVLGKPLT
ncbi:SoxR reducing system RseC family protein [Vibrio sp. SCSIO 43135]|uniref:SoxR reducing system RseC family protein n=1 Tax=Vibrio paucivorans TaxID=2829489 RepID=A0A9X3CD88_9VIBR|nr:MULTISPECIES: SoxR reducing system RseC family protein [Vibrio]MCW8333677.1 SoxR reducing system RseC family protein [Vibrio paucivorans]USD40764.1 SoxR reducing system RseC family protein [Vibrio sp. SCSIO 43135]